MAKVSCDKGHSWHTEVADFVLCPVCSRPPVKQPMQGQGYYCPKHGEKAVLVTESRTRSGYFYPCCNEKVNFHDVPHREKEPNSVKGEVVI